MKNYKQMCNLEHVEALYCWFVFLYQAVLKEHEHERNKPVSSSRYPVLKILLKHCVQHVTMKLHEKHKLK